MSGRIVLLSVCLMLGGAAAWWWWPSARTAEPTQAAVPPDLPIPPFPPRIAEGDAYESCLASLADDPAGAAAVAEAWQARGGGDGAAHCQGLALIAMGKPDQGSALLERLALRSNAPALARAAVLSQAMQGRLMVGQAAEAAGDASAALGLAPGDTELLIVRATAQADLGQDQAAVTDLNQALQQDGERGDALVARAGLWRKLGQPERAQDDVARALALNPDDPDALLERGILRQRRGDRAGARADWEQARDADPSSSTADLAEQNLALLDAGPERP